MTQSQIKKVFEPLYAILKENEGKKVASILPELERLMSAKTMDKTFRTNEKGELEVFCYYHKEWENTTIVPYGKKANTSTGLNTMCKEGTSQWTKQQRQASKAKEALLAKVASGEVLPAEMEAELAKIEVERAKIVPLAEVV